MPLFDRLCKFVINTGGGSTENDYLIVDQNFKLTFDVTISLLGINQCTVEIYNLSEENRKKVEHIIKENEARAKKNLPRLTLQVLAGYKEDSGLEFLFSGDIIFTTLVYQAPDYITTISAYGNAIDFQKGIANLSYKAGIDTTSIIKQLAEILKMGVDKASVFGDTIAFKNGISINGQAHYALNKICEIAGLRWTITANKTLKFSPIGKSSGEDALYLSPSTGIINPVKQLDSQGFQLADISVLNGWEVDILLQPKALPQRKVQIDSAEVKGVFYIESVEHKGDTRGNDWMSILQVKEEVIG